MASLLQQDARFGVKNNPIFNQSLQTLDQLLNPINKQVSKLPRLQDERDILGAEQQKKAAFKGDFAAGGLQGSKALGVIDEAITKTATTELAQAQVSENQRQEQQDRLAFGAYLSLVLNPNITGAQLNEQEAQLQLQLRQLRKSRRLGSIFGALKIIGGIALIASGGGAIAGSQLIASGAGDVAG